LFAASGRRPLQVRRDDRQTLGELSDGRRGETDVTFARAISKFFLALKRRHPGGFEYLLVNEWRQGVRHAHALLRLRGKLSRRKVRDAKKVAGLRVRYAPVRKPVGAANYLFKHTKRAERKAELTPMGFRGRMYTASKGFLNKPFKELWREIQAERSAVAMPPATTLRRAAA
jgi:hypothetical protein